MVNKTMGNALETQNKGGNNFNLKSKKALIICTAIICLCAITYLFFGYTHVAAIRTPIMDFFRWIAIFGEESHSGALNYFALAADSNEQMQPLALAINFFVLEITNYDFWVLVLSGAIVRCIYIASMIFFFVRTLKYGFMNNGLFFAACVVCMSFVVVNPNQWELMIEPFSLLTSVRLLLHFVLFILVSFFIKKFFEYSFRGELLLTLALSLLSAGISLMISSAYFVALLGSISIVLLITIILRRKEVRITHAIPGTIWFITVLGCLYSYISLSKGNAVQSVGPGLKISSIFEGLLVYLGTSVVPQNISEKTLTPFYICGLLILEIYIYIFYKFIKGKLILKHPMPILMILYAMINGIVIGIGRINGYGVGVMSSSRYTVESLVGIVGIIWGCAVIYLDGRTAKNRKIMIWLTILLIIVSSVECYTVENKMAPYRGLYGDQIKETMFKIDACSDEELAICQSEPQYVRKTAQFLRENNLSVFKDVD